jgi:hypothetical protein
MCDWARAAGLAGAGSPERQGSVAPLHWEGLSQMPLRACPHPSQTGSRVPEGAAAMPHRVNPGPSLGPGRL